MSFFHRETLIERLSREIGWRVADREGDHHVIRADDRSAIRHVNVRCRDDAAFVTIWTNFPVRFPLASITPEFTYGILLRNRKVYFGRWCIEVFGSCELLLYLHHTALKAGLSPLAFKTIVLEMVEEREAVHDLLRDQVADLSRSLKAPAQPAIRNDPTANQLATNRNGEMVWIRQ